MIRLTCVAAAVLMLSVQAGAMKVKNLRCEYMDSAMCVDTPEAPRLSWVPESSGKRCERQTAYQILVATSPDRLTEKNADLWNSGKVNSAATAHVAYGGRKLGSFDNCYWTVRVWDGDGKAGDWSKPSMWTMGVLDPDDWGGARWIALKPAAQWEAEWKAHKESEKPGLSDSGPIRSYAGMNLWQIYDSVKPSYDGAPLLRREFKVPAGLKSAQLYICGLGYFEAFINGGRVGSDVLNPAWTNFAQTSLYSHYDVTDMLRPGADNAIGVMLGRGQYNPICNDAWGLYRSGWVSQPKMVALLRMKTADGKVTTLVSDGTWRTVEGPVVFDDTRLGEIYDARREQPGWDKPAFDDSSWPTASVVEWPMTTLRAQMLPPIRRQTALQAVRRIERPEGITLFDVGQNIAGWARVKVKGPRGARVLVEYCELPSDTVLVPNLHPARLAMSAAVADTHHAAFHDATSEVRQQNAYVLKGEGDEEFECHFSYKGFQFVRITADDGVEVLTCEGVPVHTDLRQTGTFMCSDAVANRLQEMARITMLNNFMGLPTDCPHREKQGWTADGYFTTESAIYNFDMAQFYAKWMRDLRGTQGDDGSLCTVAPSTGYDQGVSVTWPAAMVYVPVNLYDFYGERRLLKELYTPMCRFAEHARKHEIKGKPGRMAEVLGDWVSPADSILPGLKGSSILAPPEGVVTYAASSYYSVLRKMQRISGLLGLPDSAGVFDRWADRVRGDFNGAYFRPSEATYYGHQPTGYRLAPNVVALYEGLVPDTAVVAVENKFMKQLAANDYKLKTGFLGTRAMMKWLPAHDAEAAWRVATQPDYPGWGYMVAQGANTMWEDWAACASVDHMPYCLISEYFYRYLAGIKLGHDDNGEVWIEISPSVVDALDNAGATYDSLYGTVASSWRRDGADIVFDIEIPANCNATVRLPLSVAGAVITESGKDAARAKGVRQVSRSANEAAFEIGSGKYLFKVKNI